MVMKISGRYQKFIATYGAAKAISSSLKPKATSFVKKGEKRFTAIVKAMIISKNRKKTALLKTPFLVEAKSEGMKLCENAPSLTTRLKRFGSLKATKNISL